MSFYKFLRGNIRLVTFVTVFSGVAVAYTVFLLEAKDNPQARDINLAQEKQIFRDLLRKNDK